MKKQLFNPLKTFSNQAKWNVNYFNVLWIFVLMAFTQTQNVSAIELTELFKPSSCMALKVSPDGQKIAQVGADDDLISNISIFEVGDKGQLPQAITHFTTPEIIQFFWSADSQKVLVLKDENGTGRLNLHGFDVQTGQRFNYTESFDQVSTQFIKLSPNLNQAIIGLNDRNRQFHDLYLLNLDTQELKLIFKNDEYARFLVSDELKIMLKMRINQDSSWDVFTAQDQLVMHLSPEDAFQTEFITYNADEQSVYFLDNRFSNTTELKRKNLEKLNDEVVLRHDPISDIQDVVFINNQPIACASYYTRKKWHVLNPDFKGDWAILQKEFGNEFAIVSQSRDDLLWLISKNVPEEGQSYWLYDRETQNLTPINSTNRNHLTSFAKMYEMVVDARDGEKLVCYYTLPKEHDLNGTVNTPIPLVVVPHGGPFKVRDYYEFNPYHQWLAGCGYAVLSVNFRLSSGFGKDFVQKGSGQWGKKAHLDVIDAVEACIGRGITKKDQVAIFGGSYGGYESLAALTFSPDYFKCHVAICGPSNLKTVLEGVPEFWELTDKAFSDHKLFFTKQAFITSMGGDPKDPKGEEYLQDCSPLNHLDQIQRPLLLFHGENDHIVLESESRQIYEFMKKNQKDVTYFVFKNEGHRFGLYANKLKLLSEAERFLSKYLKGNYRPLHPKLIANSTENRLD